MRPLKPRSHSLLGTCLNIHICKGLLGQEKIFRKDFKKQETPTTLVSIIFSYIYLLLSSFLTRVISNALSRFGLARRPSSSGKGIRVPECTTTTTPAPWPPDARYSPWLMFTIIERPRIWVIHVCAHCGYANTMDVFYDSVSHISFTFQFLMGNVCVYELRIVRYWRHL